MAAAPTSRFVLESVAELDGGTRSPELLQLGPSQYQIQIRNPNTRVLLNWTETLAHLGLALGKPLFEKWSVYMGIAHVAFIPYPMSNSTVGHLFWTLLA